MTTTNAAHHWAITPIGATGAPHRGGTAPTHADAWFAAFGAARTALLAGELDDVAFTVDDDIPTAFYSPGRDADGNLDPVEVTVDLTEMHQEGTFAETADRIIAASS